MEHQATGNPIQKLVALLDSRSAAILGVIALGFALGQFISFTESRFFEWDEAVYYSQVSPHHEALYFSATRARGITLLIAPVALLTESIAALRVFLVIVSTSGFFVAFWVWQRIRPAAAVLGAALFGSTWIALFYGSEIAPNLYSGLGSVALAGLFVRALQEPGSRRLELGILGAALFVGLFRPYDLALVGLGLALGGLITTRVLRPGSSGEPWRRRIAIARGDIRTHAVLSMGVVLGGIPWLIENSIRFRGPINALGQAVIYSSGVGVAGWGFHLAAHLSVTDGPIITYSTNHPIPLGGLGWWLTWAILAGVGIALASKGGRRPAVVLATAGLLAATGYIFLMPIVPRFLAPAYALIGLAAGFGLAEVLTRMARGSRSAMAAMLVFLAALAPLGYWQLRTANTIEGDQNLRRLASLEIGQALAARADGEPCSVWSQYGSVQIALASGCEPHYVDWRAVEPHPDIVAAADEFDHVFIMVLSEPGPASYLHGLPRVEIPVTFGGTWTLYLFTDPSGD